MRYDGFFYSTSHHLCKELKKIIVFNEKSFKMNCVYTTISSFQFLNIFKGGRLTDERIQAAQCSMINGEKAIYCFEGFISKIEEFIG